MNLDDNHTLTRNDHGDTPNAAASNVFLKTGQARRRVLEALVYVLKTATDEELQDWLCMSQNTQRPRRVELVQLGYVEDSGERRKVKSGSNAVLWRATQLGRDAL